MDDMAMTKAEADEFQERLSKLHPGAPETIAYPTRQRLHLIANLIVDRIVEDQKNGAPLLRKIEQEDVKRKNNQQRDAP